VATSDCHAVSVARLVTMLVIGPSVQKHPEFLTTFQQLGTYPDKVADDIFDDLQRFVCLMYGKPHHVNTNILRCDMFKSRYSVKSKKPLNIRSGTDPSLLPPCKSSLFMHCRRVNYLSFIWNHAHVVRVDLPSPNGCGWKANLDGGLSVEWTTKNIMPQKLIDMLQSEDTDPLIQQRTVESQNELLEELVFEVVGRMTLVE